MNNIQQESGLMIRLTTNNMEQVRPNTQYLGVYANANDRLSAGNIQLRATMMLQGSTSGEIVASILNMVLNLKATNRAEVILLVTPTVAGLLTPMSNSVVMNTQGQQLSIKVSPLWISGTTALNVSFIKSELNIAVDQTILDNSTLDSITRLTSIITTKYGINRSFYDPRVGTIDPVHANAQKVEQLYNHVQNIFNAQRAQPINNIVSPSFGTFNTPYTNSSQPHVNMGPTQYSPNMYTQHANVQFSQPVQNQPTTLDKIISGVNAAAGIVTAAAPIVNSFMNNTNTNVKLDPNLINDDVLAFKNAIISKRYGEFVSRFNLKSAVDTVRLAAVSKIVKEKYNLDLPNSEKATEITMAMSEMTITN